ncbi:hypothetical protein C8J57DRAFT_62741 [Mycena rebaudengoi]|nr:hypothetical protein C8J57DRAFT_62741 [Mycena rebaudengoi]
MRPHAFPAKPRPACYGLIFAPPILRPKSSTPRPCAAIISLSSALLRPPPPSSALPAAALSRRSRAGTHAQRHPHPIRTRARRSRVCAPDFSSLSTTGSLVLRRLPIQPASTYAPDSIRRFPATGRPFSHDYAATRTPPDPLSPASSPLLVRHAHAGTNPHPHAQLAPLFLPALSPFLAPTALDQNAQGRGSRHGASIPNLQHHTPVSPRRPTLYQRAESVLWRSPYYLVFIGLCRLLVLLHLA